MIYIGIDPGIRGALAWIRTERGAGICDYGAWHTPTIRRKKTSVMDLTMVCNRIRSWIDKDAVTAVLEEVHAMPKQGVVSMFTFGQNFGEWRGLLHAFRIRTILVRPSIWKKHYSLMGKDKDYARAMAGDLFPTMDLKLKKDVGRAEALLLAEYGRRLK